MTQLNLAPQGFSYYGFVSPPAAIPKLRWILWDIVHQKGALSAKAMYILPRLIW